MNYLLVSNKILLKNLPVFLIVHTNSADLYTSAPTYLFYCEVLKQKSCKLINFLFLIQ